MEKQSPSAEIPPHEGPIGWIGTGRLGMALAERLLAAGHRLLIWNRTREKTASLVLKGADVGERPNDLASCKIVFTCIAGDTVLPLVLFGDGGLLDGSEIRTKYVIDCSTLSIAFARELLGQLADAGIALISAPVSGSPVEARNGELVIGLSGDPVACDTVRPVVAELGRLVLDLGEGVDASIVKACHNAMMGVITEAMAQTVVLIERLGASRQAFCSFMAEGMLGSSYMARLGAAFGTDMPPWQPNPRVNLAVFEQLVGLARSSRIDASMLEAAWHGHEEAAQRGGFMIGPSAGQPGQRH